MERTQSSGQTQNCLPLCGCHGMIMVVPVCQGRVQGSKTDAEVDNEAPNNYATYLFYSQVDPRQEEVLV